MWFFWLHPLRGLAALGIIFLHSYWTWHYFDSIIIRKLYLFVDFFFVLSGFVISSGYSEKLKTIRDIIFFFKQRFRRLSFQFYLSGIIWLAAGLLTSKYELGTDSLYATLKYIFFVNVFFKEDYIRVNPVAWSVMTEIWVYFFFGALALFSRSPFKIAIFSLLIVITGASTLAASRTNLNILHGFDSIIRSGAGFFFGSFCWYIFSNARPLSFTAPLCALALSIVSAIALIGKNLDILSIPVSGLIILAFSNLSEPRNSSIRDFLHWMGDISYPLYLWHFVAGVAIAKIIENIYAADPTYHNGEKFATLPSEAGFFYCLVLLITSITLSVFSLKLERRFRRGSK